MPSIFVVTGAEFRPGLAGNDNRRPEDSGLPTRISFAAQVSTPLPVTARRENGH